MQHFKTLFDGGLSNAGLMVGLHDLRGLFQPKNFYDCMSLLVCLEYSDFSKTNFKNQFFT